jgi:hypothetical protein
MKLQRSMSHPSFPPFDFYSTKMISLISLKRCGIVGVGLGAMTKEKIKSG